jgi:hypothetical protein
LGGFGGYRLWFVDWKKVEFGGAEELVEVEFAPHHVCKLNVLN